MKKILLVAICFAAMGHVVAQAQESPVGIVSVDSKAVTEKSAKKSAKAIPAGSNQVAVTFGDRGQIVVGPAIDASKADKKDAKAKTSDRKAVSVTMTERGQIEFTPGVDPVKTSSVASVRPNLVVKERNPSSKAAPQKATKAVASKGAYGSIIARYASAYGVPVSLAHAVIRVESNYRVNARGSAGEIGLMQIKPATARGLGYSGSAAGLFNPETNIKYGMKYLGMAHKLGGGSTCGTILKYNAGHGAKRMNPVSANYCAKVKRHLGA